MSHSRRVGCCNINNRPWEAAATTGGSTSFGSIRRAKQILANCVAEEDPMCRHAKRFTVGVLAGAVYLAGGFSFSPAAQAEPPNFGPNPNVGWYSYNRTFIPVS